MSFYATNSYIESMPPLIEVYCENMHLRIEEKPLLFRPDGDTWKRLGVDKLQPLGKGYWGVGHILCIKDFYDSIQEGCSFQLEIPGVEATTRLMLMMYTSARQERIVR